jgi:DNA repair exonuclease SbcCD ATPase subunit
MEGGMDMFIKTLRLHNVRSFEDVSLNFSLPNDINNGINLIIGPNMSGKSTLFKSILWGILGPRYWNYENYNGPLFNSDMEI